MKLSLIFPAYNEAASIIDVLESFYLYCVTNSIDHEIIVVDDGSTDATGALVKNFATGHPSVRLIEHISNQGYGSALRSGFSAATGDYIFFTDSDGQFSADDLDRTLPRIDIDTIVLGYRQPRAEGLTRRFNSWGWGRCIRFFLGLYVRDLNCAWKLFPRTVLTDITLTATGAFINAELLYYVKKKKLTFKEIAVGHKPRASGSPTGADPRVMYSAFRELVNFKRRRELLIPSSPAALPELNS